MIGILCMVRELVDLVGLCPYGPSVRPCVEPERSPQVQGLCHDESVPSPVVESPELPRTADPEQSLVEAPRVALFSAMPFEVEVISTLDDTVENDTAVFEEVEEHDLVFNIDEADLFSTWDQEQQQADEWWEDLERRVLEVSEEVEALSEDCGEVKQRLESDDETLQMFGANLESEGRNLQMQYVISRVLPCCGPLDLEEEGVSDVEDLSMEDDQVFTDEHDRVVIWDEEGRAAMRRVWFRRHFMKRTSQPGLHEALTFKRQVILDILQTRPGCKIIPTLRQTVLVNLEINSYRRMDSVDQTNLETLIDKKYM
ncbi:unnamed protein product [Mytilus coruscus]|uniref:Uncharacterized protein n=1 Tax=Mytilus coruscus TaxID=42192 RepID=A0A6J8CL75_MYTCO|nr:unnamed protein product [Mytilus coruscus]